MEIWLPNQDEAWAEAQAAGEVVSVGQSLGKDWQSAFVIPAYLQEQYPELDSVEDLKDEKFQALFATAATGGKARLVSCVIGWSCEEVNAAQIEGYGLSDYVEVINPGDGAAMNADLYGAYEKKEPWLGYQWGTNDAALLLDLVRLDEPEYTDECWFTTKACAYEDATILIAVNPDLLADAPDVVTMLRAWDFNIEVYKEVAAWLQDNPDADANDAAIWWLNSKVDVWQDWVTDEAAEAIKAALDANEIPDGWPEE
jgi:glycine betaine/proline transport system substrate-binding protein